MLPAIQVPSFRKSCCHHIIPRRWTYYVSPQCWRPSTKLRDVTFRKA